MVAESGKSPTETQAVPKFLRMGQPSAIFVAL